MLKRVPAEAMDLKEAHMTTDPKIAKHLAERIVKTVPFIVWNKMSVAEKIHLIRSGIPARCIGELASVMGMERETVVEFLGLSHTDIARKVQLGKVLSPGESERVLGMLTLLGGVQAMIDTESAPDFDAAKWLSSWLVAPLPALDGSTPASYMDTVEGQRYVSNLLEMAQSGAYA